MEPITLTASTIAALIIAGAANKVGESLVEGGFKGSSQLVQHVQGKFETRGKENLLTRPAEYPVELQAELISQMAEDEEYKERLEQFLESIGITYQIAVDNLEIEEAIEIGNINLEDYGSRLLQQIGLKNTKAKNVKIDTIQMRSEKKTLN